MKKVLEGVIIFIVMIMSLCILLTLSSMIPTEWIKENVKESAEILNKETNNLQVKVFGKELVMGFDNYTDALMINTAYSIDTETPFYSAMVARKDYVKGITEVTYMEEAGRMGGSSKYEHLDQVAELNDTVNNDAPESFEYARYWHAYLIILRPMLIFFNITQIRIILIVIFAILAAIFLYLVYKKANLPTAFIFLGGLLVADYFYIGLSLQGAPVYLITMIASIVILQKKNKINSMPLLFFIIGGLTSAFDFLTVPIVTLGIPLLVYALFQNKENAEKKRMYVNCLVCTILWGLGYATIWATKWVLFDVLFNRNIVSTAINQFLYRSQKVELGALNGLYMYTLWYSVKELFISSAILTIILIAIKTIKLIKAHSLNINISRAGIYFIIGAFPIAWLLVLTEHTLHHYYFTYRNFWLLSTGLFLGVYYFFDKKNTL